MKLNLVIAVFLGMFLVTIVGASGVDSCCSPDVTVNSHAFRVVEPQPIVWDSQYSSGGCGNCAPVVTLQRGVRYPVIELRVVDSQFVTGGCLNCAPVVAVSRWEHDPVEERRPVRSMFYEENCLW